jgi:D-3-phosphoglycerate dehydrogenase
MSDPVDSLVKDLVNWIGDKPRPYAEVMEAWKTSCPKLPVWEEANQRGLLRQFHDPHGPSMVELSKAGRALKAETSLQNRSVRVPRRVPAVRT